MGFKIKVKEGNGYAGGKGFPKKDGTYIITVKDLKPGLHKGPYSVKARWSNYAMDWVLEDRDEIPHLHDFVEVIDYKPFNQEEYDRLREQEQIRDLGSVRRKEPFNIPVAKDNESKQGESYYIDMYSRWGSSMGRVTGDTIKEVVTKAAEQMDWLPNAEIRRMVKKSSETKGEAYYSQGNRDGRNYTPMKTHESFPSRAAFLSYKKGYNEALDGIYEADDAEFNKEIKDLKSKSNMGSLVDALDNLTDEQLDLLELGFGDGEKATKMDTEVMDIPAKDLHPTQNEIDVKKSLGYQCSGQNPTQIKQILENGPVTIKAPVVVYDYNGTYYIVDGHHRWSQIFLLNPNCKISCLVFKNSAGNHTQDPADMLRDFQGAIAVANDGEMPSSTVESGYNIFDWMSESGAPKLKDYLDENIKEGMINAYREYYNSEIDKDDIKNAILANSGLMNKSNKPIKNAPTRDVMPQTEVPGEQGQTGIENAKKGMTDL